MAIWNGDIEIVKFLVSNGTDINETKYSGNDTPLDVAKEWGVKRRLSNILFPKGQLAADSRLGGLNLFALFICASVPAK